MIITLTIAIEIAIAITITITIAGQRNVLEYQSQPIRTNSNNESHHPKLSDMRPTNCSATPRIIANESLQYI